MTAAMNTAKIAIGLAALACGSDALAADANSQLLELKCAGVVYENRSAKQNKYDMDMSLSINLKSGKIIVNAPFFTNIHIITKSTPSKYYIISEAELIHNKNNNVQDLSGDVKSWTSTIDRTNGYLIMIERDDYGNHAFNGTCSLVKAMF